MSQSPGIAAGGALHPVLPNTHKMLSMAALVEMSKNMTDNHDSQDANILNIKPVSC